MLKNYLKIAFRNLKRDTFYVVINILGLAIGMGVCFIIAFYIQGELSYDTFHEKKDRIFRLTDSRNQSGTITEKPLTSYTLANQLESEIPEIETIVTVFDRNGDQSLTDGISIFNNINYHHTESEFFDVFDVEIISGNKARILDEPTSIVLSEELAIKIFGHTNILGKELSRTAYQDEGESFVITGVFKDLPQNSHFQFDALRSFESLLSTNISIDNAQFINYVLVNEGTYLESLSRKTNLATKEYLGEEYVDYHKLNIAYQPLSEIYLGSLFAQKQGNPVYIPIFITIAIFILLIAIINYTNLAIARSIERNKEVGIRKVVGASRLDLIKQFLGESILYSCLSIPIALVILDLFLPYFNSLMNSSIAWDFGGNIFLITGVASSILFVGLLSSLYPAFIISSFKPIQVFNDSLNSTLLSGRLFRKSLITIQFMASSLLIISTVIISKQLNFIQEKNLGLDKELLVLVDIGYPNQRPDSKIVKASFLRNPYVADASLSFNGAGNLTAKSISELTKEGEIPRKIKIINERVDSDYISTVGLTIIAGSDFIPDDEIANEGSIILNRTGAESLGWDNPQEAIGKQIKTVYREYKTITAIIEDFHFESVHNEIKPIALVTNKNTFPFYKTINIKIAPGNLSSTIESLEETWIELNTGTPLEYTFLEDSIEQLYKKESNISSLFNFFSFISIALSCFGLLGLTAYTTSRRTKEIGIRKVLGASIANIIALLSKDFLVLVILGFTISIPITWYGMSKWLSEFAYRIEIGATIYILSAIIAITIAVITVSTQSIKTALANPVDSLKND